MVHLTDRQQTGVWFIVTGLLILSFWVLAFPIVNWAINTNFIFIPEENFSNDQLYVIGGSLPASVQIMSLVGVPILLTGVLQVVTGVNKTSAKPKK